MSERPLCRAVDPFVGCAATDLPTPRGLAARWWWPKPQIGNTHPGACWPLGMVSVCPYSGAYPTGYGLYDRCTEGVPPRRFDDYRASGFTHFQQSGTGAIRKYYNYFKATPLLNGLAGLGQSWRLENETASPGYYAARLRDIVCELTIGPKVAVHRYRFRAPRTAGRPGQRCVAVDFSCGGLALENATTLPQRADVELGANHRAVGTVVFEGVPVSVAIQPRGNCVRAALWYDGQVVGGGTRLSFDHIRETNLRPFGVVFSLTEDPDAVIELVFSFSLRGVGQAEQALQPEAPAFDHQRTAAAECWERHLSLVQVESSSEQARQLLYTNLYRSLIKPCFAKDESPFWSQSGPFVFDLCTMWDIYKTQLPLLSMLLPERSVELVQALLQVREEEGNFPIGYRMSRGADRFFRQASALVHTFLADVQALGLPGIDWEWALSHMHGDLLRTYGEDFREKGLVHPITHTLDLAGGYSCTAQVARRLGDPEMAARLSAFSDFWRNAYDGTTGLLKDSTYYEGTKFNYSFRLLHAMSQRIEQGGGDGAFVELLDRFFGFDAPAVEQPGVGPSAEELSRGYALGRFEGLNNEPDMETPYAYYYAGRPDRTADIVAAVVSSQFGLTRGGLVGNDDSGALSSWYVWATLGLFPVAGQGIFLISPPVYDRARIAIGDSSLEITRRNACDNAKYIQSVKLDGKELGQSYLTAGMLSRGGALEVTLGADRGSAWGRVGRPPSV